MSVSVENFIKAIYELKVDAQEAATSSKLALKLSISNAAITDMAKKLHIQGLVIYQKYKEIQLTEAGEQMALSVIRRHRLWETFLSQVLSLGWDKVHDEAERLEHETSDFLLGEIDKYLGYPKFDPHGDPIPDSNLNIPIAEASVSLEECTELGQYKILRVQHHSEEITSFLTRNNLEPGKKIELLENINNNYKVIVVDTKEIVLTNNIASQIRITQL